MAAAPEFKVCGLTRPDDAALAASLGARFVGTILVGGPRLVTPADARAVYAAAPQATAVAVVPLAAGAETAALGRAAGAAVLQLHADPSPAQVADVRAHWDGALWAVVRLGTTDRSADLAALAGLVEAIVCDTATPSGLGGSGVAFDWARHRGALDAVRGRTRLVLAGGLTPDNISEAWRCLAPDVLDVSSGVEASPGRKSPDRLAAFGRVVRSLLPSPPG